MAATVLTSPQRVQAIHPDDVPRVERWAASQRGELARLRLAVMRAGADAKAAEEQARAAGDSCPPDMAAAVDALLSTAVERLVERVEDARSRGIAEVERVVTQCRERVPGTPMPDLAPDPAWVAMIESATLRRPATAAELWRQVVTAGAGDPVPDDPLLLEDLIQPSIDRPVDPYGEFWKDAPSSRMAVLGRRRPTEATQP